MIGLLTKVNIIDNSGGIEGKCIRILQPKSSKSGKHVYWGKVGDLILVTLTKVIPGSKTKKGSLYKGLIVRTKKESNKGLKSKFNLNKTLQNPLIKKKSGKQKEKKNSILIATNLRKSISKKSQIAPLCEDKTNKKSVLQSLSSIKSRNLFGLAENKVKNKKEIKTLSLKLDVIPNSFDNNAIILVKLGKKNEKDYSPLGTRIKGPLCKSLKWRKGCSKIISLTTNLI